MYKEKLKELINKKLKKMPHGVDPKVFYPIKKEGGKFTFLMNKGFRNLEDRGGTQYGIKAYMEEFDGSDTQLIVKINPVYGIPDINQMFPGIDKRKDIVFDINSYKYEDLVKLYANCDVFLSPTRAEAFNIPCLEALACGKPVITTNFGGQTDFCTEETGFLIDYNLSEVEHELEYESCRWAVPDHNHLKSLLRYAFEHPNELLLKGKMALEDSKSLTWESTAKKIHSLI